MQPPKYLRATLVWYEW